MADSTTIRRTPIWGVQSRYLAWIAGGFAALAILAAYLWLTWVCSPFVIDDAFISFRYAENLARGYGLVFNPGERVEGYTNFLWVMLIAASNAVGGDSLVTARVVGVLANLATLLLVGTATFRGWLRPVFPGLALLPPILLAANYGFVLWGIGGLETSLFTLVVTAGLLSLARASGDSASTGYFYCAGGLFALAVLARPDATVLFAGAVLGWGIWAVAHARFRGLVVVRLLIGCSIFLGVL